MWFPCPWSRADRRPAVPRSASVSAQEEAVPAPAWAAALLVRYRELVTVVVTADPTGWAEPSNVLVPGIGPHRIVIDEAGQVDLVPVGSLEDFSPIPGREN